MKRFFKHTLAAILLVSIVLSLAACGGTNKETEDTPVSTEETLQLTAFAVEGPYTKGDFNDLRVWELSEEKTGVKVTFESTPAASSVETINLKFASNSLPDIFFRTNLANDSITKYSKDGALVPISPYLEEHAPNLMSYLNGDPSIEKALRMSDNEIYGFPYLVTAAPSRISPKIFANEKWLAALNLELPTTTEEMYNVLLAMRDFDYNENGEQDEIPLMAETSGQISTAFMGSFGLLTRGGAQSYWDIDETGKLRFIRSSENYKEYLQYINRLYSEKLVDQEFFTTDLPRMSAQAAQRTIGFALATNSNYLDEYGKEFTYLKAPLIGPNGDQIFGGRTIPFAGQNTFITSVNEHPAESVAWVDWFYSPEGIEAYFMGIKGETYEIIDGVPQFTDYVTANPDGLNMEEALGTYVSWSGGGNPSVADDLHFGNHLIPKLTVDAAEALYPFTPEEIWGGLVYDAEDSDRLSVLRTDIDTYISDMDAKFITGEIGFDQWDSYLESLERLGLSEYYEITQRAIDSYNKR